MQIVFLRVFTLLFHRFFHQLIDQGLCLSYGTEAISSIEQRARSPFILPFKLTREGGLSRENTNAKVNNSTQAREDTVLTA